MILKNGNGMKIGSKKVLIKNNRVFVYLLVLLSLMAIFCYSMGTVSADPSMIYVNNETGNDTWDGETATWNGTSGPKLSIKNATGAVLDGGTVNLAEGIYIGTDNRDITIDKNMIIQGASRENTIIDAQNLGRIFTISTGVNITIRNLSFENGNSTQGAAIYNSGTLTITNTNFINNTAAGTYYSSGGTIFSNGGNLNLTGVVFTNNKADRLGGALDIESGVSTIIDCVFTNNTSILDGGGAISNIGTMNILNSTFTNNSAVLGSAVYSEGALNITGSYFFNNYAEDRGAILANGNTLIVNNCTFIENTAFIGSAITTGGSCTINNTNFINNIADENGGAITNYLSCSVNNSTFTSNYATGSYTASCGAAICNEGDLNVTSCDFRENKASKGVIYSFGVNLLVLSSNFQDNRESGAIYNDGGDATVHFNRFISNGDYEIVGEGNEVDAINNWWGSNEDPSGRVDGNVVVDPWIIFNKINANPTAIYIYGNSTISADLTWNSADDQPGYKEEMYLPVVDGFYSFFEVTPSNIGSFSSNDVLIVNGTASTNFIANYIDGVATVYVTVDQQAVDTQITILSTKDDVFVATTGNDTTGTGSYTHPYKTISKGITEVNPNGRLHIANGSYKGSGNTNIGILKNLSIMGESQSETILDAEGSNRIFVIFSGFNVTIQTLTLKNGYASSDTYAGGAIKNSGNLIITNLTFNNNSAGYYGYGGAIYSTGTLTIVNSTFINNTASSGGYGAIGISSNMLNLTNTLFINNTGYGFGGAIGGNLAILNVNYSEFTNNTVTSGTGEGGAIYLSQESTMYISNSIFNQNRARNGGTISQYDSTITINNSIFTNNTLSGDYTKRGGAIYSNGGTLNVNNSIFNGNGNILDAYDGSAIYQHMGSLNIFSSEITGNNLNNVNGGAIGCNNGTVTLHFNRIVGNSYRAVSNMGPSVVNATNNWWGSNNNLSGLFYGNIDYAPWLMLNITALPNPLHKFDSSIVAADLTHNSVGDDTSSQGHVPDGIPVRFDSFPINLGLLNLQNNTTINGNATTTFTSGYNLGNVTVNATVDNQTVNATINIESGDVYVSTSGNDTTGDGSQANPYLTILKAINEVYPYGTVHMANGTYSGANNRNITINKSLSIVGENSSNTLINGGLNRIFSINTGMNVRIQNLTFTNGSATNGAAIYNNGNLTLTSNTFINNTATGSGGAIYNNNGLIIMHFNRIFGNLPNAVTNVGSAQINATNNWWGINNPSGLFVGDVNFTPWILLNITTSTDPLHTSSNSIITADLSHNSMGDDTSSQEHIPDGILVRFNSSPINLGSLNLQNNTTINGNATTTFTAGSIPGTLTINATVDNQTISITRSVVKLDVYVSTSGNDTTGDGSQANPYLTILKAINEVYPYGTVHMANGTYSGANNRNITINKSLSIVGENSSNTLINGGLNRIFSINTGMNVRIQNLTFTNGSATNGAAIYNNGNLTLTSNTFINNTATNGGAIYNNGVLAITSTNLTNNTATSGGAIYSISGTVTMHFNRIAGNSPNAITNWGTIAVNATNNWWGTNNPSSLFVGDVNYAPWIMLNITVSNNLINTSEISTVVADLIHNSNSEDTSGLGHIPDGIQVKFNSTSGSLAPLITTTLNGHASTTFTPGSPGLITLNVTVDSQTMNTNIDVYGVDIYISPTGSDETGKGTIINPYLTINKAFEWICSEGRIHILNGIYQGPKNQNITINKNVTILGENENSAIIDAVKLNRIFTILPGISVTIQNLTLKNGNATYGGGIYNNGTLMVIDSTFTSNIADWEGGAIYNKGTLTVIGSTFTNNTNVYSGGSAIYSHTGNFTINGCNFLNNTYISLYAVASNFNITNSNFINNTGFLGGAILIESYALDANISNCNFVENSCNTGGGAIYRSQYGGPLNITNSTFFRNNGGEGGAITSGEHCNLLYISDSIFTNNTARGGGAIRNGLYSNLRIENSIFTNNSAYYEYGYGGYGGAVWSDYAYIVFNQSTFINNTANHGGSIFYGSGYVFMNFNRIIDNSSSVIVNTDYDEMDATNNWWGSNENPSGRVSAHIDVDPWIMLKIDADPELIDIEETSTIHTSLNYNSVDEDTLAVYGNFVPSTNVLFTADSLGNILPVNGTISNGLNTTAIFTALTTPGNSIIHVTVDNQTMISTIKIMNKNDIYVSPTGNDDNGNGTPVNPFQTISKAINVVNPNGRVHIMNGTYTGPKNRNITIGINLSIIGTNQAGTIINAENNEIFIINESNVKIQNLTLINGYAIHGGAIYNNGTLNITDVIFTGNNALDEGGAINNQGNLTIAGSTFNGSTVRSQGGAICNNGTLNITNCTFTGNTVIFDYGGAVSNNGTLTGTGNIFTGNTAGQKGGAIYNNGGTFNVNFSKFIQNTAADGNDVCSESGAVNLENNWWGTNFQGTSPAAVGRVNSNVTVTKWIVLNLNANPTSVSIGGNSIVTADLAHNNLGEDTSSLGFVPTGGNPVLFVTDSYGNLTINNTIFSSVNQATTVFTGLTSGSSMVNVTFDYQTVQTVINILDAVYVSPSGNDTTGDGGLLNPFLTIQKAMSTLNNGGTINVASGTYCESLVLDKMFCLVGAGSGSTILSPASASSNVILVNSGGQGSIITGFNITGAISVAAILLNNVNNTQIHNNTISGNTIGVAFNNAGNNTVSNVLLRNNGAAVQIYLSNLNMVLDCTLTSNDFGVYLLEGNNNTVANSLFTVTNVNGRALYLESGQGNQIKNNNITGGVYGVESVNDWQNTYSGNNISLTAWRDMYLLNPVQDIVSNNQIHHTINGLLLLGGSQNQLIGNTLNNCGSGLEVVNSLNNTLNNNNITQNTFGMYIYGNMGTTITLNTVNNCGSAIELHYSSENSINLNDLVQNTFGVYIVGGSLNSVENNIIFNTLYGGAGVHVENTSYNSINNNSFTSDVKDFRYGIYINEGSNNSIINNNAGNNHAGLELHNTDLNQVFNNDLSNNTVGLFMNNSSENVFNTNALNSNGAGVEMHKSHLNTFNGVNVTGSTFGFIIFNGNKNTIINSTLNSNGAAINLQTCINTTIDANRMNNNSYGVYILNGDHNLVQYSAISDIKLDGSGVFLDNTIKNTVKWNSFINTEKLFTYGIYGAGGSSNLLESNTAIRNHAGIELHDTVYNLIKSNNLSYNTLGVFMWLSSQNNLTFNNINNNGAGIEIHQSTGNNLSGNNLTSNVYGLYLDQLTNSDIRTNDFTVNTIGLFSDNSNGNDIYTNNFDNNSTQAYDTGINNWDNGVDTGNCWSDFSGTGVYSILGGSNIDHYPTNT